MATSDKDKVLNFDFHYAICLLAIDELTEALKNLYGSIWLLTSGNDAATDTHYRSVYHGLLRLIADECSSLTITDDFRIQYEAQSNDTES